VIASRPGLVPAFAALALVAGQRTTYDVPTLSPVATPRAVRRWAAWKPWSVIGPAQARILLRNHASLNRRSRATVLT
jgi:hypothetical protein